MGNEPSKPTTLYGRIAKALPPIAPQYGHNENGEWVDKGVKAFASEGDRDQFIYGLISLLTSNGSLDLANHDIKLFFSRRRISSPPIPSSPSPSTSSKPAWRSLIPANSPTEPDDGTRLLATLVAIDEAGVIRVKIASESDGRDVAEAFREFKRDVECKLEKLLSEVPNGAGGVNVCPGQVGVARVLRKTRPVSVVGPGVGGGVGSGMEREVGDAPPPAYGDGDVKRG